MIEVFEGHVKRIKRSSNGEYIGLCPFHDDNNPSFSFNDIGVFYCHACEIGGNAYQFAKMVGDDAPKMDYIERTPPKAKIWSPPQKVAQSYNDFVSKASDKLLLNYDEYIGGLPWNKSVVQKLMIGWDEGFVFPYLNSHGDLVNIKWHKRKQIYGHAQAFVFPFWHMIHKYKKEEVLYLVEGEKDCVTMISKGKQAVSFNNGAKTKVPKEIIDIIKARFNDIVIYFDPDQAGRDATFKFLERYG